MIASKMKLPDNISRRNTLFAEFVQVFLYYVNESLLLYLLVTTPYFLQYRIPTLIDLSRLSLKNIFKFSVNILFINNLLVVRWTPIPITNPYFYVQNFNNIRLNKFHEKMRQIFKKSCLFHFFDNGGVFQ